MQKIEASNFSQLTFLLRLVTLINFEENLGSSFTKKGCASASDSDSAFALLDSIAAILVQEHEIVAACYTSDTVSVVFSESESDSLPGPRPETDVDVVVDFPSDGFKTLNLAALSNPAYKEELSNNQNLHKVQIQTEGETFWENIRDAPEGRGWYFAFM
jgi:hypothetical protein